MTIWHLLIVALLFVHCPFPAWSLSTGTLRLSLIVSSDRHLSRSDVSTENGSREPTYAGFQKKLLRYLFNETIYDRRVRPVHHHRTPINVTIRLNLYQLVDVSERSQNVVL